MKRGNPEKQVAAFNTTFPVGSPVWVRKDDGRQEATKTRSEAWVMGGHSAMVMLDGIAGGYACERVTARVVVEENFRTCSICGDIHDRTA